MNKGRTDRASREIAASPTRLWLALTDPDQLVQWLPPAGMTGRIENFDLRPGGGYRMTLTYDDPSAAPGKSTADSDVVEVRFVTISPESGLTLAGEFEAEDASYAGTMTMRWELSPATGGTLVSITAENVPPGISAEDHDEGLRSSLENLAAYVE